jgi:hypothetical protein
MPYLPDISDRVWYALHCLRRDPSGAPPSYKSLEAKYDLPEAFLSKLVRGSRKQGYGATFTQLARALRVTEKWLDEGGDAGTPWPTGVVPPRPDMKWTRHGDLGAWGKAVQAALAEPDCPVPPEAFLAGADLPVYRPVATVTPALATAVAIYAWETCTEEDQLRYGEQAGKHASAGNASRRRTLTSPSAKR